MANQQAAVALDGQPFCPELQGRLLTRRIPGTCDIVRSTCLKLKPPKKIKRGCKALKQLESIYAQIPVL